MTTKIHQRQLTALKQEFLIASHLSFGRWLYQHVGKFGEDWGRTYNLSPLDSDYGCTWWFKREQDAVLTLLRWS